MPYQNRKATSLRTKATAVVRVDAGEKVVDVARDLGINRAAISRARKSESVMKIARKMRSQLADDAQEILQRMMAAINLQADNATLDDIDGMLKVATLMDKMRGEPTSIIETRTGKVSAEAKADAEEFLAVIKAERGVDDDKTAMMILANEVPDLARQIGVAVSNEVQ